MHSLPNRFKQYVLARFSSGQLSFFPLKKYCMGDLGKTSLTLGRKVYTLPETRASS